MAILRLFFIFTIIFQSGFVFSQRFDATLLIDGKQREFIVSKPTTKAPPRGYPVVFMLHGTSGDGEKFYNISGWKELGEIENFITVFPSSLRYCVYNPDSSRILITKWNNGDLQSVACPNQDFKDDVKFFRKMTDTISAILPVNEKMIFVAGFSNGGVMAAKLALEMSDVFSAATCTGAFLHDLDSMRVKVKIPVWNMFGTQDSMFIERSGRPYIPFNDTCLAYLRNGIHNYLGSFGLDSTYAKSYDSLMLHYEYTQVQPGESAAFFRHTMLLGMTHQYPNGINYPVKAQDLHWEFFKSVSGASRNEDVQDFKPMQLWPNPASDVMFMNSEENVAYIEIYDLNGLIKARSAVVPGAPLDLRNLPPQVYVLHVIFKDGKIQKTKFVKSF